MTERGGGGNSRVVLLQWLAPVLGRPKAAPPEVPATGRRSRGTPPPPTNPGANPSPSEPLSFDAIYQAHFEFVWRTVYRFGVSYAELDDAAHDVFLVVHKKLADFDGRANVRSWLFAIAQRVAWHYRRTHARRRTKPLEGEDPEDPETLDHDGDQSKREAITLIHQVLDCLSEERRAVFILAELENMTMPVIAEMLRLPLNTAYSRLRLARRDFEKKLRVIVAKNPSLRSGFIPYDIARSQP